MSDGAKEPENLQESEWDEAFVAAHSIKSRSALRRDEKVNVCHRLSPPNALLQIMTSYRRRRRPQPPLGPRVSCIFMLRASTGSKREP